MIYQIQLVCVIVFAFVSVCCGSDMAVQEESPLEHTAAGMVVRGNDMLTTDSFVKAGWKKSKQYDTDTVPQSTEIWYGFYQQKDIEIRFYNNHQDAVEFGIPAAESSIEGAVKRSRGGKLLDISGGSFSGYADYIVAGNTVLLCEFDRTRCEELISNIE